MAFAHSVESAESAADDIHMHDLGCVCPICVKTCVKKATALLTELQNASSRPSCRNPEAALVIDNALRLADCLESERADLARRLKDEVQWNERLLVELKSVCSSKAPQIINQTKKAKMQLKREVEDKKATVAVVTATEIQLKDLLQKLKEEYKELNVSIQHKDKQKNSIALSINMEDMARNEVENKLQKTKETLRLSEMEMKDVSNRIMTMKCGIGERQTRKNVNSKKYRLRGDMIRKRQRLYNKRLSDLEKEHVKANTEDSVLKETVKKLQAKQADMKQQMESMDREESKWIEKLKQTQEETARAKVTKSDLYTNIAKLEKYRKNLEMNPYNFDVSTATASKNKQEALRDLRQKNKVEEQEVKDLQCNVTFSIQQIQKLNREYDILSREQAYHQRKLLAVRKTWAKTKELHQSSEGKAHFLQQIKIPLAAEKQQLQEKIRQLDEEYKKVRTERIAVQYVVQQMDSMIIKRHSSPEESTGQMTSELVSIQERLVQEEQDHVFMKEKKLATIKDNWLMNRKIVKLKSRLANMEQQYCEKKKKLADAINIMEDKLKSDVEYLQWAEIHLKTKETDLTEMEDLQDQLVSRQIELQKKIGTTEAELKIKMKSRQELIKIVNCSLDKVKERCYQMTERHTENSSQCKTTLDSIKKELKQTLEANRRLASQYRFLYGIRLYLMDSLCDEYDKLTPKQIQLKNTHTLLTTHEGYSTALKQHHEETERHLENMATTLQSRSDQQKLKISRITQQLLDECETIINKFEESGFQQEDLPTPLTKDSLQFQPVDHSKRPDLLMASNAGNEELFVN